MQLYRGQASTHGLGRHGNRTLTCLPPRGSPFQQCVAAVMDTTVTTRPLAGFYHTHLLARPGGSATGTPQTTTVRKSPHVDGNARDKGMDLVKYAGRAIIHIYRDDKTASAYARSASPFVIFCSQRRQYEMNIRATRLWWSRAPQMPNSGRRFFCCTTTTTKVGSRSMYHCLWVKHRFHGDFLRHDMGVCTGDFP